MIIIIPYQKTRLSDNKEKITNKKRIKNWNCRLVDFAVSADHRVKIKQQQQQQNKTKQKNKKKTKKKTTTTKQKQKQKQKNKVK